MIKLLHAPHRNWIAFNYFRITVWSLSGKLGLVGLFATLAKSDCDRHTIGAHLRVIQSESLIALKSLWMVFVFSANNILFIADLNAWRGHSFLRRYCGSYWGINPGGVEAEAVVGELWGSWIGQCSALLRSCCLVTVVALLRWSFWTFILGWVCTRGCCLWIKQLRMYWSFWVFLNSQSWTVARLSRPVVKLGRCAIGLFFFPKRLLSEEIEAIEVALCSDSLFLSLF